MHYQDLLIFMSDGVTYDSMLFLDVEDDTDQPNVRLHASVVAGDQGYVNIECAKE